MKISDVPTFSTHSHLFHTKKTPDNPSFSTYIPIFSVHSFPFHPKLMWKSITYCFFFAVRSGFVDFKDFFFSIYASIRHPSYMWGSLAVLIYFSLYQVCFFIISTHIYQAGISFTVGIALRRHPYTCIHTATWTWIPSHLCPYFCKS